MACLPAIGNCFFVVAGLLLLTGTSGHAEMPVLPRGKGERCVEPTDVMRKDHMNFLYHQRDKTVYQGIRTRQHSLTGCIDCHAQADNQGRFIAVNAPRQFCQTCHSFASVKLDCFECHAATPDEHRTAVNAFEVDSLNFPLWHMTGANEQHE